MKSSLMRFAVARSSGRLTAITEPNAETGSHSSAFE